MKVLDTFSPRKGVVAYLLACRCVRELHGRPGPRAKELVCRKHDRVADSPPSLGQPGPSRILPGKRPSRLGRRRTKPAAPPSPPSSAAAGTAVGSAPVSVFPPATPIQPVARAGAAVPSHPPGACSSCGRVRKLPAKGLCWTCYGRSRKGLLPVVGIVKEGELSRILPAAVASVRRTKAEERRRIGAKLDEEILNDIEKAFDEIRSPDVKAMGSRSPAVALEAGARVAAGIRAARPGVPEVPPPTGDVRPGLDRLRELEELVHRSAYVKDALARFNLVRRPDEMPPDFEMALEDLEKAQRLAGWIEASCGSAGGPGIASARIADGSGHGRPRGPRDD